MTERAELAPGRTLTGRYRIDREAVSTAAGPVWAGHDTILDRAVLVFPLPYTRTGDVTAFTAKYAAITHPCLIAIYDASPGWLVCEHPPGGRLAERTGRKGLSTGEAARAVRDVCRALRALHDHDRGHGALGEDVVFFDEEGRAKLAPGGVDGAPLPDDLLALAELARRAFPGRDSARRRGMPAPVAAVVERLAAPDPSARPSLRDVEAALEPFVPAAPGAKQPGFFRQEARWLFPVLAVILAAVVAVLVGLRIEVGGKGFPIKIHGPTQASTKISIKAASDFDPDGNKEEHHDQVPFAADGNPLTQWTTQGYRTANVGGKKGVGVVFDLGVAKRVSRIEVQTSLPGWTAEWRAADAPAERADDFATVAAFTAATKTTTAVQPAKTARYWLLWITTLVQTDAEFPYQAAVAEVSFFG